MNNILSKLTPQVGDEINIGDEFPGRIEQLLPSGAVMMRTHEGCRIFFEPDPASNRWLQTVKPLSDPQNQVALGLRSEPPQVGDATSIDLILCCEFTERETCFPELSMPAIVDAIDADGLCVLRVPEFKLRALAKYFSDKRPCYGGGWQWLELPGGRWI